MPGLRHGTPLGILELLPQSMAPLSSPGQLGFDSASDHFQNEGSWGGQV